MSTTTELEARAAELVKLDAETRLVNEREAYTRLMQEFSVTKERARAAVAKAARRKRAQIKQK